MFCSIFLANRFRLLALAASLISAPAALAGPRRSPENRRCGSGRQFPRHDGRELKRRSPGRPVQAVAEQQLRRLWISAM